MASKRFSWVNVPLRWKVTGWFAAIMTVTALILGVMFLMFQATFRTFGQVQQSHMIYYVAQEALETEYRAFETYIRENSRDNLRNFEDALTFKIALMVMNYMEYLDNLE